MASSSSMRFSSNIVPETKITNPDDSERTIMFAESPAGERPERPPFSRTNSRQSRRGASFTEEGGGDITVGIAGLLADYKARQRASGDANNDDDSSGGTGSSYSTQDLALSFNDLPSRAQHLILNELMRQQSGTNGDDTGGAAVLFTTLPIPDEGTHRDERASVQYLSDVELLCQGLPPVLMILSNNMTVTVSL
ncbi:hypothetical protein SCUCBS95973_005127 [Sporothrix curviconia]|uniref:SLC12A transporter C-terminal domain-containing protein n=1 Tax=Sporothrix curviconia TaxID=1260050 RepID=A0ABP0BV50_9PEZI